MKEVSVIVASYNPDVEKLLFTVDSVLKQTGIDLELIITDDGSGNDHFGEVEQFIKNNSDIDYLLLCHKQSQGTVKNILDAVEHANGKYIRTLGMGDAIAGTNTLRDHVNYLEKSGKSWSFGQMIYFSVDDNGNRHFVKHVARPQITKTYMDGDDDKCIWQYCVLKDIATGTAILYEKDVLKKYLNLIKDKVIYVEDYIGMIMTYDGLIAAYYPHPVVYYEFASGGISDPSRKDWSGKIVKDINAIEQIMIGRDNSSDDQTRRSVAKVYARHINHNRNKYLMLLNRGKLSFVLKKRLHPVYTDVPEDESVLRGPLVDVII